MQGGAGTAAEIVADPRWFPHRYDFRRDEVHFVWLPREAHRTGAFLTDPELTAGAARQVLPRRAAAALAGAQAPLHLILHSGLTCSTLLARALDQPGAAMSFNEPPILTDIVSHRLSGPSPADAAQVLDDLAGLLARPFGEAEAVIVKVGSVGNGLGQEILARRPTSRALCLHAPLPVFLASVARKGLWGRLWGRKLFIGLRNGRMAELGFSDAQCLEHTDLQTAAAAWLSLHRILARTGAQFGEQRVRSVDSERLTAGFSDALGAIAAHFELPLDAAAITAVVDGPLFQRHAKTGEAFDRDRRSAELAAAQAAHADEIDKVVFWTRKMAETFAIPWDLPAQLRF